VKYLLLIYHNPAAFAALSEDELSGLMGEANTIMGELRESGEWIGGEGLADPSQTITVRAREGVPAVTDGPYVESKEHLAGFCMIECETPERATEIAIRWPDARYWGVELRQIMTPGGAEM
jgi:hypothetical protein